MNTSLTTSQVKNRKRSREVENPLDVIPSSPLRKRLRIPTDSAVEIPTEAPINPIDYWRRNYKWPEIYSEPEHAMSYLLARSKSVPSLRHKRPVLGSLTASSITPSDQKPREEKSAQYGDIRYVTLLETKGSFMRRYMGAKEQGINEDSKRLCQAMLETEQGVPKIRYLMTIDSIRLASESKTETKRNAKLECLIESVNEGWNNSIPLTGPRPQPDYSVGFRREAFTKAQLDKLSPFIGNFLGGDLSFFMATYYMYFPFLSCEVKCGGEALDVADRQNAHSMTLAVRAIVELFRLVKREGELHREVLSFSISHSDSLVRIYGHYPVIEEAKTTFYLHNIHTFDFTTLDGRRKWAAYKFTKNVYDIWMPTHLDRICSAIDEIPSDFNFGVPPLPQESELSQDLGSRHLSVEECGSQLNIVNAGGITPNTSFTDQEAKRPKRNS